MSVKFSNNMNLLFFTMGTHPRITERRRRRARVFCAVCGFVRGFHWAFLTVETWLAKDFETSWLEKHAQLRQWRLLDPRKELL
jgi:hypothetical protein